MTSNDLTFIHTEEFDEALRDIPISDGGLAAVQLSLQTDPEAGDPIPGTGGVRKLRVAAKGKGKRGGARFLYYYVARARVIYLLLAYDKSESDDISEQGKRVLHALARKLDGDHP